MIVSTTATTTTVGGPGRQGSGTAQRVLSRGWAHFGAVPLLVGHVASLPYAVSKDANPEPQTAWFVIAALAVAALDAAARAAWLPGAASIPLRVSGSLFTILGWLALLVAPVWIAAALAPLALVRFQPKWALKFRGSKLNPFTGLKRLVSMQTLAELGKTILKVVFVFAVGVAYIAFVFNQLGGLARGDTLSALQQGLTIAGSALALLLIPIAVIAGVDVALQWFNFRKRMRMTPEELRKELKETEGSPELRARLRQRQRQIATSRMMAALERADVVVTNPEHFAVALRYDMDRMAAPVVVAKGIDEIALRIQSIALEKGLPIARIPPLARYLRRKIRIGEVIPAQLFEAVAQVLAWAYDVRNTRHAEPPPPPTLEDLAILKDEAASSTP